MQESTYPTTNRYASDSPTSSASATRARQRSSPRPTSTPSPKFGTLDEDAAQPHPSGHRRPGPDRRRSPQGHLAQHQAPDRNPVLPWPPPPPFAAGPRPAHPHQRPHPQGPAQGHCCRQEESDEIIMAKTQNKAAGAKTAGKNKKFKKRERKNVPYGLVFIQASFNNTIVTITDQQGNTLCWKIVRLARLPRLPQGNPVRRAAGRRRCSQRSPRPRPPLGRCPRLRSRLRPRVRDPRPRHRRHRGSHHPRRHAHAAQRLPSAQAPPRLMNSAQRYGSGHCVEAIRLLTPVPLNRNP